MVDWQSPFLSEYMKRSQGLSYGFFCKEIADIVDGQIMFSQRAHFLSNLVGAFRRRKKELVIQTLPKLVGQDEKAPFGVSEPLGRVLTGDAIDKECSQSLILPVGTLEKPPISTWNPNPAKTIPLFDFALTALARFIRRFPIPLNVPWVPV